MIEIHDAITRNTHTHIHTHSFEVFTIFIFFSLQLPIQWQIFIFIVFHRQIDCQFEEGNRKGVVCRFLFECNKMTLTHINTVHCVHWIQIFRFDSNFRPIAAETWLTIVYGVFKHVITYCVSDKSTIAFAFRVNKKIERASEHVILHSGYFESLWLRNSGYINRYDMNNTCSFELLGVCVCVCHFIHFCQRKSMDWKG